jgi:hypothetical protein
VRWEMKVYNPNGLVGKEVYDTICLDKTLDELSEYW